MRNLHSSNFANAARFALVALSVVGIQGCAAETDLEQELAPSEDELSGAFPVGTDLTTTADLNMRRTPSRSAEVLQVIPKAAVVKSASAAPRAGWYGITYKGMTGWVDGAFLSKPGAATPGGTTTNPATTGSGIPGGFCEFSWEEKPGYADYTTINWYERSIGAEQRRSFDRAQGATLQGSGKLNGDLCQNARVLKTCFTKAVAREKAKGSAFLTWAAARNLDPVRAKMAFSFQETFLGKLNDDCRSGICNGVGIAQIITAYASDTDFSRQLGSSDVRWDGISFNVLTNLAYSSRVLSEKVKTNSPSTLVELARAYNGNPDSSIRLPYGPRVQRWYDELGTCGL